MHLFRSKHVDNLVDRANIEFAQGRPDVSWRLLEEAHIVAQPMPAYHIYVHWRMLVLAFNTRDRKELIGQFIRFILAAPGSISRKFPVGNTGRSNVDMFTAMPIPQRITLKIQDLDLKERLRLENGGEIKKYVRTFPMTRR